MNDGIVERLRVWSDNAKEQDVTEIVVGLCQAADEIERLRNDLDGTRLAYRGASYDRDRMRAEIERLRKERDHARLCACDLFAHRATRNRHKRELWYAQKMGWDCFKETP